MKRSFCTVIIFVALGIAAGIDSTFPEEPGNTVKLDSEISPPKAQIAPPALNPTLIPVYSVRPGDCLFGIAKIFNISVAVLKKANNQENTLIQVGQQLYIPLLAGNTAGASVASINRPLEPPPDDGDHPLRLQLVEAGIDMLGIRYRRGGSKESGFDCSGLVKNLFSRFNIELPRSSRQQYKQGKQVDRNSLEIGDLVFFSSSGKQPDHVGIYIGENLFLHAALKAQKVIISDLGKTWYAVRFIGARRIMDLWKDEPKSIPKANEAENPPITILPAKKILS